MEKGALIGRGRTAEVYAWGDDRILKLFQPHLSGPIVEKEYQLTQAAKAAGIPVPAADGLIEVDGRHGIIFEKLAGPSMLKTLAAQPWRINALARQLAELHAQIHRCALQPDIPGQRQQIEQGIQAAGDLPEFIKEASLSRLAQLPEGIALCHGDFHPDNIIMTAGGPVIIDWMTARRGNPLADVGRTLLLFQTTGLPPGLPFYLRPLLNTLRFVIETTYLKCYLEVHPASRQQIDAWQLPLMAARLREVEDYPKEKQLLLRRLQAITPQPQRQT